MGKLRLVMKRLHAVAVDDVMVGRDNWHDNPVLRRITGVHESGRKPGKLSLVYSLPDRQGYGKVRRWPDFYVICIRDPNDAKDFS